MSPGDANIISLLTQGGVVGLLAVIVIGALREWWVPGSLHRRLLAESHQREQEWKQLALQGTELAQRAVIGLVK